MWKFGDVALKVMLRRKAIVQIPPVLHSGSGSKYRFVFLELVKYISTKHTVPMRKAITQPKAKGASDYVCLLVKEISFDLEIFSQILSQKKNDISLLSSLDLCSTTYLFR